MIDVLLRDDAGLVRPMGRHDLPVLAGMAAHAGPPGGALPAALLAGEADMHGLVVERFSHVVGYVLVRHGETARIAHLLVHPGSRGLGLGRMLIEAAVAGARAAGCRAIAVGGGDAGGGDGGEGDGGEGARAFYAACGFADPRPIDL